MGQDYNLTAPEMNLLLKEEGFLDGGPGSYSVTEKGKPYADEQWTTPSLNTGYVLTTWAPSITDELDITDERKQQIREVARAARQQKAELRATAAAQLDSDDIDDAATNASGPDILEGLFLAALVAGSIYGIIKVAPRLKRLWTDKAAPSLKKLRNRTAGDTTDRDEHPPT